MAIAVSYKKSVVLIAIAICIALLAYFGSMVRKQKGEMKDDGTESVVQVALGGFHTCVVTKNIAHEERIKCFGDNLSGQLGLGLHPGSKDRPSKYISIGDEKDEIPQLLGHVNLGEKFKMGANLEIAAGEYHTCAKVYQASHTYMKCWGSNGLNWGQLGLGHVATNAIGVKPEDMGDNLSYLDIPRNFHINHISTSFGHSCALLDSSKVMCWGMNEFAQAGYEDFKNRFLPVQVDLPSINVPIKTVKTGGAHTCVIYEDGQVLCWGSNYHGQLGTNDINGKRGPSGFVQITQPAKQISLGSTFTCAILNSGHVQCWGRNNNGAIGLANKTMASAMEESIVPLEHEAVDISSGKDHSCALLSDRSVWCWGSNKFGQLGCNTYDSIRYTPCKSVVNATRVETGNRHTCALLIDKSLYCWGDNTKGQLGQGDRSIRHAPALVHI